MASLQKRANDLYGKYQQTARELNSNQRTAELLSRLAALADIVKSSIASGDVLDAKSVPISDTGTPTHPNGSLLLLRRERVLESEGVRMTTAIELRITLEKLEDLDSKLVQEWRETQIPIPTPDPAPYMSLPLEKP
jgi:hypothetical protein